MKTLSFITLSTVVTSILTASKAHAIPPESEWYGAFPVPVVACDTKDEIKAIVEAANKGSDELTAAFTEYHDEVNATGEPVCVYRHLEAFAVAEFSAAGRDGAAMEDRTSSNSATRPAAPSAANRRLQPSNYMDLRELCERRESINVQKCDG